MEDGRLIVDKVPGEENPADLMAQILEIEDAIERLERMRFVSKCNEGAIRPTTA